MSYTNYDFSESLTRVAVAPDDIDRVVAAWGRGDGQGTDSGPVWSEDGVTEWSGGFLFRLKDGRFAYVTGWCDYTGWGCQDGAEITYFDAQPELSALPPATEYQQPSGWDIEPADLNKWLAAGGKDPYND